MGDWWVDQGISIAVLQIGEYEINASFLPMFLVYFYAAVNCIGDAYRLQKLAG